jgi:hypothetical protein
MKNHETKTLFGGTYSSAETSATVNMHNVLGAAVTVEAVNVAPAAADFVAGVSEVDTLTFPAKNAATNGDYVSITDTNGDKWAVALSTVGVAEVTSITAVAEGSVAEKTQIVAIAEGSVKNVTQVVCTADASGALAGASFKVYDKDGSVGVWFSVDGVPAAAPAGAAACTRQVEVEISEDDANTAVAGAVTTAFALDAGLVVGNVGATVTMTDVAYAARTAASDAATVEATGFAITTTAVGHASNLHTKYFILKDEVGTVGVWFDVDAAGASAPSHGAARAVKIDSVTSGMTAAQVGTKVYDAIHADSKFNGVSDTSGTIVVVSTTYGNKTGQGAGDSGFTVTEHTAGVASALTGKYFKLADVSGTVAFWFDVGNEGTSAPTHGADRAVEITSVTRGMTAAQVAGVVRTAIDNDSKFDVGTLTDATFNAVCKDLKSVANGTAGDSGFTVSTVTQGADTTSPTGAIWTAIAAGKKGVVDISAATDAASVATAVQTVLAALTDIGTVITVGSASTADIPVTHVARAPVANPVPKSIDDAGAGSITVAQTTEGVASSVGVLANSIAMTAHGYVTGLKGQLTVKSGGGTLPTGVTTSTDYFVIAVDANTIKLAASLANALAGTEINLTGQGTAANTFTFTATALAGCSVHLEGSVDGIKWIDIASASANITATSDAWIPLTNAYYHYMRAVLAMTAGQVTLTCNVGTKEAA